MLLQTIVKETISNRSIIDHNTLKDKLTVK